MINNIFILGEGVTANAIKCNLYKYNINIVESIDKADILLVSPGYASVWPQQNDIIKRARMLGINIISDIDLFQILYNNKYIIGVTGTNGKTTVCSMVAHIFKENNINHGLGGNIGTAVFDIPNIEECKNIILELSSFQLQQSNICRYHIAAITNITHDHLDRHGSYYGYVADKQKIFLNHECKCIINIDEEYAKDFIKHSDREFYTFSMKNKSAYLYWYEDSLFCDNSFVFNTNMCYTFKQNFAVAFLICKLFGMHNDMILNAIKTFCIPQHRQEFVCNIGNINFINDSKATNWSSTINAIQSYENIYLILGGIHKNEDMLISKELLERIVFVAIIGVNIDVFLHFCIKYNIKYRICIDINIAIEECYKMAKQDNKNNDIKNIVLSPACSSFDQFNNYEHRGEVFKQIVQSICNCTTV